MKENVWATLFCQQSLLNSQEIFYQVFKQDTPPSVMKRKLKLGSMI